MRYKVKTNNYYKEENSIFYTCTHCGIQHRSKRLMKKIHIPNCLEKTRKPKIDPNRLSFIVTIESLIEETVFQRKQI